MKYLITLALMVLPMAAAAQNVPRDWLRDFPLNDFATASVDFAEILSGGPPRDGIPALFDPVMIAAADDIALSPRDPVLVLDMPGHPARAYPLRYLTWHEIVNDQVGDVPVAVTYCPLCNTGMVFDRRLGDRVLTFGVSGRLRHSDMIMYDHQTETWWQQALGQAIVGQLTGEALTLLPAWLDGWAAFQAEHPNGLVMAEPGRGRRYGANPYVGYDTSAQPFLYQGENPPHGIHPLARVVRVGERAWPLERIRAEGTITEVGLTLTWAEGQASALDAREIAQGAEVGRVRVRDGQGRDVVHDIPFAFAFHAFHPQGRWMLAP